MARTTAKIRLFVEASLGTGAGVALGRDQARYLFGVMRLRSGDSFLVFDGRDREWLAEVADVGKRAGVLTCREQTRPQALPPDFWLACAHAVPLGPRILRAVAAAVAVLTPWQAVPGDWPAGAGA